MNLYRLSVVKPLEPRQRKHTVFWYRVGATSEAEAIAAWREEERRRESEGQTQQGEHA